MSEAQTASDCEHQSADWTTGLEAPNGVLYERVGGAGVLSLRGNVDIFEAQAVHAAALRTLRDEEAAAVTVDLMNVQRMDISTIQVLAALQRDLGLTCRTVTLHRPEPLAAVLTGIGILL